MEPPSRRSTPRNTVIASLTQATCESGTAAAPRAHFRDAMAFFCKPGCNPPGHRHTTGLSAKRYFTPVSPGHNSVGIWNKATGLRAPESLGSVLLLQFPMPCNFCWKWRLMGRMIAPAARMMPLYTGRSSEMDDFR